MQVSRNDVFQKVILARSAKCQYHSIEQCYSKSNFVNILYVQYISKIQILKYITPHPPSLRFLVLPPPCTRDDLFSSSLILPKHIWNNSHDRKVQKYAAIHCLWGIWRVTNTHRHLHKNTNSAYLTSLLPSFITAIIHDGLRCESNPGNNPSSTDRDGRGDAA